jgi:hypothetical protein
MLLGRLGFTDKHTDRRSELIYKIYIDINILLLFQFLVTTI